MANTSSAKKALRSSKVKEAVNKARKSRIRTFIRKVEDSIKSGNEVTARTAFKALEPEIMKGVTKKVFKLNTAARKLRRLAESIRKLKIVEKA
jgi:small subunit ribosomal protein S20